jgi:hypothetical protein
MWRSHGAPEGSRALDGACAVKPNCYVFVARAGGLVEGTGGSLPKRKVRAGLRSGGDGHGRPAEDGSMPRATALSFELHEGRSLPSQESASATKNARTYSSGRDAGIRFKKKNGSTSYPVQASPPAGVPPLRCPTEEEPSHVSLWPVGRHH